MESFYFNLFNYLIIIFLLLFFKKKKYIDSNFTILLSLITLFPFLINYLYPNTPDQSVYFDLIKDIRSFNYFNKELINCTYCNLDVFGEKTYLNKNLLAPDVKYTSIILSIIPIPFIVSLASIGLINKLLFILIFIYLFKDKTLNLFFFYFLIFYPSFIFYSSMGLRESLVVCMVLLNLHSLIKKNIYLFIFSLLILYLIKFSFFIFLLFTSIGYFHFFILKTNYLIKILFIVISLFILSIINIYLPSILSGNINATKTLFTVFFEDLEWYRLVNIFQNKYGIALDPDAYQYQHLHYNFYKNYNSFIDFFSLTSYLKPFMFLLTPFKFNYDNIFFSIKSLENFIILFLMICITLISFKDSKIKILFWLGVFYFYLFINSMVFFNIGTIDRMRMPIVVAYFFIFLNDTNFQKNYKSLIYFFKNKIFS